MAECKIKAIQTNLGTLSYNYLRHPGIIQAYSAIFRTLCYPNIFKTVVYSEPWHIQNQKHIQNPCIFTALVYSEPRYIQNASIFKIWGIYRTLSYIYTMSKVEIPSKVSLELTTRINLGRWLARPCQALDLRHSPQAPSQSWKGYPQVKKGPIVPIGTIINLFRADKTAAKVETTSKVSLELTTRINLQRRVAHPC